MAIMDRSPHRERIVTKAHRFYVHYPHGCVSSNSHEQVYARALSLEHRACGGSIDVAEWIGSVRRMGFLVSVEKI